MIVIGIGCLEALRQLVDHGRLDAPGLDQHGHVDLGEPAGEAIVRQNQIERLELEPRLDVGSPAHSQLVFVGAKYGTAGHKRVSVDLIAVIVHYRSHRVQIPFC